MINEPKQDARGEFLGVVFEPAPGKAPMLITPEELELAVLGVPNSGVGRVYCNTYGITVLK